jgi:hypothetical protein
LVVVQRRQILAVRNVDGGERQIAFDFGFDRLAEADWLHHGQESSGLFSVVRTHLLDFVVDISVCGHVVEGLQ